MLKTPNFKISPKRSLPPLKGRWGLRQEDQQFSCEQADSRREGRRCLSMHQQQRAKRCLLPADTIGLGREDRFLGRGQRQDGKFVKSWGTSYKYENYFQINKMLPWNQGEPVKWELFCESIPKPREMILKASPELCPKMPLPFEREKQTVSLPQVNTKHRAQMNLYPSNKEQVSGTMGSNCYFYLEKWIATFCQTAFATKSPIC